MPNDHATTPETHLNGAVRLTELRRGERGRVQSTELSYDDSELLRAMGMSEDSEIRVCRNGAQCIVAVHSTRLGLCSAIARKILVTRPG